MQTTEADLNLSSRESDEIPLKEIASMWTLEIRSPNERLYEYNLKSGVTSLGRNLENDIQITDESASRSHAEILFDEKTDSLEIRDLGSTNGTFLNGKRIAHLQPLLYDDQIRIGLHLFTVHSTNPDVSTKTPPHEMDTSTISSDLLIESVEHYAVLLHYIGRQLNNVLDLDTALAEVSELIERMMGADHCRVITAENFDSLEGHGIPDGIGQKVIAQNLAAIIANVQDDPSLNKIDLLQNVHSILCAPVTIDKKVVGLIYTHKSNPSSRAFDKRDFQLVVAIGHQVALTIQRKKAESELLHNANHDALTDLPNRILYLDRLWQAIRKANNDPNYLFAVLFFDLDHFKLVNDSLGHMVGDKFLIAVAERLAQRPGHWGDTSPLGIIARLGGDEFAILVEDIRDVSEAISVAEDIQDQLKSPFFVDGHEVICSASIGITLSSMGYQRPEDMLRDADIAMYRAKELGRAKSEVYDQAMHDELVEKLRIQTGLRKALPREELLLHYQPIISLQTGQIKGFEALIRWDSPDFGLVFPDKFLNSTNTTGLLNTIDHWVLQTACMQVAKWQNNAPENSPLFVAVNLSSKQIKHPGLVDQVKEVLLESELDPGNLWLELTEGSSIEGSEATLNMLSDLRKMNVHLCLDDFGTGFSSLSYLHRLPVNSLKIDRSFINAIDESDNGSSIIRTILSLADQLRMSVVAEGVEKPEQLDFLRTLECQYAQGFYFARPMHAEAAEDLIATNPHW